MISTPPISRNNIRQKCEGNCGLWVLKEYPENMKEIVGVEMGWISCAI